MSGGLPVPRALGAGGRAAIAVIRVAAHVEAGGLGEVAGLGGDVEGGTGQDAVACEEGLAVGGGQGSSGPGLMDSSWGCGRKARESG